MKAQHFIIFFVAQIGLLTQLHAEVRISNSATSGMVFIGNTWQPTSGTANLSISDLLLTLSANDVTVVDFTPTTCLGPMIIDDPVIYNLGNQLSLSSCQNILVYDVIENQGNGGLFLSSTGSTPGTGYVVVGTGVGMITAVTNGAYGLPAAPPPDTSKAVHIGSMGGSTTLTAPFLIAVVGDTSVGQYAQVGLPRAFAGGSIGAFSGQSIAVSSGVGAGCYGRIGHGDPGIIAPVNGQIDVVNENGDLYIQSFPNQPGTRAAIGHINQIFPADGAINVTIEGNLGSGNIWMDGGPAHHAGIGHESLSNGSQSVLGHIVVQGRGILDMNGGSCVSCAAVIGHRTFTDMPVTGQITVETGGGVSISGGTSGASAGIGHEAMFVGTGPLDAAIVVATADDLSVIGGIDGPGFIGHRILPGVAQGFGEISLYVRGDVQIQGGGGVNSAAIVGHYGNVPLAVGAGNILCRAAGSIGIHGGTNAQASAHLGHETTFQSGRVEAITSGGITSIAGAGEAVITAEEDVLLVAGDSIELQGPIGLSTVRSNQMHVTLKAGKAVVEDGTASIEPATSLTIEAGEDIKLNEAFFPQNGVQLQTITLDADHAFLSGDLWSPSGFVSFFLPGLFNLTGLSAQNPVLPDDGAGAFVPTSGAFQPTCNDLIIQSSHRFQESGLFSSLEIGFGVELDPSFIQGYLQIGDRLVASDTSSAIRQSYSDINIHDVTFGTDSCFVKGCREINLWNAVMTMNGPITFVADAKYPVASDIGSGVFTCDNVQLSTSPQDAIRIYSATQSQNTAAGGVVTTTFNGIPYTQCTSSCLYESWSTYYDGGTMPTPGTYMFYYKDSPVLSIQAISIDAECLSGGWELGWQFLASPGTYQLSLQALDEHGEWLELHSEVIENAGHQLKASGRKHFDEFHAGTLVRLQLTDNNGQMTYSPVQELDCGSNSRVLVFPNPAHTYFYLDAENVATCRLFDLRGVLVREIEVDDQRTRIDTRELVPGMYVLKSMLQDGQINIAQVMILDE